MKRVRMVNTSIDAVLSVVRNAGVRHLMSLENSSCVVHKEYRFAKEDAGGDWTRTKEGSTE
jgi:hypothetical protein